MADTERVAPGFRRLVMAAVVLIFGIGVAWLLLTGKSKPVPKPEESPLKPVVSVMVAAPAAIALPVLTQGSVEPRTQITLGAQVGGRIDWVAESFVDGGFFRGGDTLLRIEQADYEYAVVRAKGQVAAARQRLAEERGRHRQAQREWRDLGTRDANALFLREPQLKAAEAALAAAEADLDAAELALDRTWIRAPFDGRIVARQVDLGQVVAPGNAVADIYATDRVLVRLPLSDAQRSALQLPLDRELDYPVTLTVGPEDSGEQWQGVIRRTEATVDRRSRFVNAIVEVPPTAAGSEADQRWLVPGMFVQATIPTPPIPGLVRLPGAAIRSDSSVLLVDDEGLLSRAFVTVHRRTPDWSWVTGLAKGARVVRAQGGVLASGMTVDYVIDKSDAGDL